MRNPVAAGNRRHRLWQLFVAALAASAAACGGGGGSGKGTRSPTPLPPAGLVPAFPGAEGFGSFTAGGRGGRVCKVTQLGDAGAGSLRACLSDESGARIVVFETGGTIELRSHIVMQGEADSFVTVAGQTAPGGGIQLKGFGISMVNVHDVVIRHLRSRPGVSAGDVDAFEMWGTDGGATYNIVLDSVSAQHAQDENISAWGNVHDVTVQHSLIAESAFGGGESGFGFLAGTDSGAAPHRLSIHKNVLASNEQRNPMIKDGADLVDWRSNLIYNWEGTNGIALLDGANVNLVDNHYIAGPDSRQVHRPAFLGPADDKPQVWASGNWSDAPECQGGCPDDEWAFGFYTLEAPFGEAPAASYARSEPVPVPAMTVLAAGELVGELLPGVGADLCAVGNSPWYQACRDATDVRIVDDIQARAGSIGHDGIWPVLDAGTPIPDTDGDGMPDAWELANGLDPNDASDRNGDRNDNEYTDLEDYLNGVDLQ